MLFNQKYIRNLEQAEHVTYLDIIYQIFEINS
jgi:hypothetical protein